MSLAQFRNFQVNHMQLDDLLSLSAFGKSLKAQYESFGLDVPDWIDTNLRTIKNAVNAMVSDAIQARIKNIQSQLEALKTPTERRDALQRELNKLTKSAQAD